MPILRQTSMAGVPPSTCLSAYAICSSVYWDRFMASPRRDRRKRNTQLLNGPVFRGDVKRPPEETAQMVHGLGPERLPLLAHRPGLVFEKALDLPRRELRRARFGQRRAEEMIPDRTLGFVPPTVRR